MKRYLRKAKPRNYSLFVRNVPSHYRSNSGLENFFKNCFAPDTVLQATLRINAPTLTKLVETHDDIINKIEHAIAYEAKIGKPQMINDRKLLALRGTSVPAVNYYATQLTDINREILTMINEIQARIDSGHVEFEKLPKFVPRKYDALSGDVSLLADDGESDINILSNVSKVIQNGGNTVSTPYVGMDSVKDLESDMAQSINNNEAVLSKRNVFHKTFTDVKAKSATGVQALTSQAKLVTNGANLVASSAVNLGKSGLDLLKGLGEGEYYDSGFVSFTNLATANAALQMLHYEKPFDMEVHHAPDPEDSKFSIALYV